VKFKSSGAATIFTVTLKRLAITAPFAAPVSVTLTYPQSFDRRGTASSCTPTRTALRCREP
jgi:hypothetical protein